MSNNYKYKNVPISDLVATSKPGIASTINTNATFNTTQTTPTTSYPGFTNMTMYNVPSQYEYIATSNIGYSYQGNPISKLAKFVERDTGSTNNIVVSSYNRISGVIAGGGGGGGGGGGASSPGPSGAGWHGKGGYGASGGKVVPFSTALPESTNEIRIVVGNAGSGGAGGNYNGTNGNNGQGGGSGNKTEITITANSTILLTAAGGIGGGGGDGHDRGEFAHTDRPGNGGGGADYVNNTVQTYTGLQISNKANGGRGGDGAPSTLTVGGQSGQGGQGGYALIFLQKT